ncbi:MAG: pyruvate dehydrogenase (acetyl-transferring) E1 component subunit alpha [Isosphaeraceae bacterium]
MFAVLARLLRDVSARGKVLLSRAAALNHLPRDDDFGGRHVAVTVSDLPGQQHGVGSHQELEKMAQAQTEAKPMVTRNQAVGWLRQMLLIRRFEERSAMLYQNQKIGGFCHLYSGQESVAVGSIGILREDDYVITAYRDHGHALARGMEPKAGMAEMLGKSSGCSKGKGGSMHFFDAEKGFLGGHAIVGSHIPIAAGVAFAIKYKGGDQVCICYFGDGAMDQGSLHEALNMASLWKLPVIYVVENNLMSMGTHLHRHSWTTDLTVRGGPAYGMPGVLVDGNDIEEMARVTREAVNRARAGDGPTFIEAKTYRFRGHSMSDPMKYRTKEEAEKARERDPIVLYETTLKERGWIDEEGLQEMHERIKQEVDEAIEFAEQAPEPSADALYQDVTVAPHIPQE